MTSRQVAVRVYCLAKRLTLGQGKGFFDKEIIHSLRIGKKILYFKEKEYKAQAKLDLSSYLEEPISKYSASSIEALDIKKELQEFLAGIDDEEDDEKIPDYLICPITCELILDPVLLSSGHTYEREVITTHFEKNGFKDPMTGEAVNANIVDNINLRQAIEDYIEKYNFSMTLGTRGVTSTQKKITTCRSASYNKLRFLPSNNMSLLLQNQIYTPPTACHTRVPLTRYHLFGIFRHNRF
jgi:hypothetical protein